MQFIRTNLKLEVENAKQILNRNYNLIKVHNESSSIQYD